MWTGKRVVVGITGGVAAYKAAELVSRLRQQGAEADVVMTQAAIKFISPVTLAALAGRPVLTDMFTTTGQVVHVEAAQAADLVIIAPATADFIARLAVGLADELLSAMVLATRAPVLVFPAMNANMYAHPATQGNLRRLEELGYWVIQPESGFLACGAEGPGRLPPTEVILDVAARILARRTSLQGVKVLVTAGPTREYLDPVRFLSNASSGKMGYAVAAEAASRGAKVVLVTGPTTLAPPAGVEVVRVESAAEMFEAVMARAAEAKVIVKTAAVADFRPRQRSTAKLKKGDTQVLLLELERTPDILAELGRKKLHGQILVGFAAETHDPVRHAQQKLQEKNLDLMVLNDLAQPGAGFEVDTNVVTLIYGDGRMQELPLMSKQEVARRLWDAIETLLLPTSKE
ncbi:MAG: bifunctional phosphopantothenoylcysteine decarboxylase/phosphopantothenate--cysteine ligase CoaBC [Moorellales bacterium]